MHPSHDFHSVWAVAALVIGFALIQNINNFALAAVTRLRNHFISVRLNLLIAAISGATTGIAVILGSLLKSQALRMGFDSFVDLAARGALIAVGLWLMISYIRKRLKSRNDLAGFIEDHSNQRECRMLDSGEELRLGKAIALGLLMASDNLGFSSLFGLVNPLHGHWLAVGLALAFFTGVFSFIAVALGQISADETRRRVLRVPEAVFSLELASSILIIVLGVYDPSGLVLSHGLLW